MTTVATEVLVCDRWPLTLRPGSGGHFAYLNTISSKNTACFLALLDGMTHVNSVVEYFGGVGLFATVVQQVLHPLLHRVYDLDGDCVAQLQSLPQISAAQGDAHALMGTVKGDLQVLDFPVATIRHHGEWPWAAVFERRPRYVVFSDTALRRIGLHRALYSGIFGVPVHSHEDYVRAYSRFMWDRYGYRVTMEAHHQYSYMRLEQANRYSDDIVFRKVTR